MVVWLAEIGYFLLMRSMEAAFLLVMIIQISVTSMGLSFSTDSSQSRRIYAKGTGTYSHVVVYLEFCVGAEVYPIFHALAHSIPRRLNLNVKWA